MSLPDSASGRPTRTVLDHSGAAGHGWSKAATRVWGKSCRDDDSMWLPLVQHLWDAMEVAGRLWDEWVPTNVQAQIEQSLPEESRDGRALVRWLAGIHDVGKSSPAFSVQVPHLAERMRQLGAAVPTDLKERALVPHATVGEIAVQAWLEARHNAPRAVAKSFAAPVGAHHGRAPMAVDLGFARNKPHLLGDGLWSDVREEILDRMAVASGADQYLAAWSREGLTVRAQMLATAVVILADWIASDDGRFGYRPDFTADEDRAEEAWDLLDLPTRWLPQPAAAGVDDLLADRFPALSGRSARPVQRSAVELAQRSDGPCLLLVEAPMGVGKTEAALLAAEALAERHGLSGVFVGLPTMATSDAMFSRVLDWVERLPGDGAVSTFLAHSKAALNDTWGGLLRAAYTHEAQLSVAGVYDDTMDGESARGLSADDGRAEAVAVSWLGGRKKGALATFVVGTIDQALFAALHAKHLMLRHLAMAGKVVVIDEVHAADDYMRIYLSRALEWFAAYGVPVVLLSATLPSGQREELATAYARGLGQRGVSLAPTVDYPALTMVDAGGIQTAGTSDDLRASNVTLEIAEDGADELVRLIRERLRDGGCAAVIQNTVSRAQATYDAMVREFGSDEVTLVHSRLLAPERALREGVLRDRLGPPALGRERPERHVVVGTQVLEQSLDIDFDVMVTDIAPVDLVLQRMGRLHRHERDVRPDALVEPQCFLTGITAWDIEQAPTFDAGCEAVYGRSRLLRSCVAFGLDESRVRTVMLPTDIRPLVERAYGHEPEPPQSWADDLAESDQRHWSEMAAAVGRAGTYLLAREPRRGGTLSDVLHRPMEATEDRAGGASVRDGDGSLDVVVVLRVGEDVRLLPGEFSRAGELVPTELDAPSPAVARAAAACTLRLPHQMCQPWVIDRVIGELETHGFVSWQRSPWLAGQLVLCLDETFSAQILDFRLTYDLDLGLQVSREGSRA